MGPDPPLREFGEWPIWCTHFPEKSTATVVFTLVTSSRMTSKKELYSPLGGPTEDNFLSSRNEGLRLVYWHLNNKDFCIYHTREWGLFLPWGKWKLQPVDLCHRRVPALRSFAFLVIKEQWLSLANLTLFSHPNVPLLVSARAALLFHVLWHTKVFLFNDLALLAATALGKLSVQPRLLFLEINSS